MNQQLIIGKKTLDLRSPKVMGILNLTPDSFFDGGKYNEKESIRRRIEQILTEGAAIVDMGAYSTRPGACHISEAEEFRRLLPALTILKEEFPEALLSVDTFRAAVAKQVHSYFGDCIINDISGGTLDPEMFNWIATQNCPYILMHLQGTPQTMQQNPTYENVVEEVYAFLANGIASLREKGSTQLILDLGFGFGKTLAHNYKLLDSLERFKELNVPILAGISRKSMIYKLLDILPQEALNGTTALNMLALTKGADILRVHDVREAVETVRLYNACYQKDLS